MEEVTAELRLPWRGSWELAEFRSPERGQVSVVVLFRKGPVCVCARTCVHVRPPDCFRISSSEAAVHLFQMADHVSVYFYVVA